MRKWILNIHLAIGIVAGAFVTLLGATGGILAFESELDRLSHHNISYVKPGDRALSLLELGDAISQKYPGEEIVAYLPSTDPGFPAGVILPRGIVSINQYTGEILGVRTRGQSFLGTVHALHVRLAMGSMGPSILKWSSLATVISLCSGLYLWWPVKRMRIGGRWWSARFWYDLHSTIGFYSLLPVLVLAGTGTVIGFEDQVSRFLENTSSHHLSEKNQIAAAAKLDVAPLITPDQAVAIARAQIPDAVPYRVQMPRYGGFYVVALEYARDRATGKRNLISLDPESGRVVSAQFSSDLSLPVRFLAANHAIHNGSIWGMPSRIVAALASILLPIQAISGLLIWLRRKGILHTR
jgi:sulfite reductase (NADPH) flavoprotein alpha-component